MGVVNVVQTREVNLSLLTVSRATTRDLAEWDDFNYSKPIGTIYHSNPWVRIHQRTLNYRVIQLVAREEGKLVGLFPFRIRDRTPRRILGMGISGVIGEVVSPLGEMENPYGGPVCDGDRPDVLRSLLKASMKLCGALGSFTIKFSPSFAENVDDPRVLQFRGSTVKTRETILIGLEPTIDQIKAGFRRDVTRAVRKAESLGVRVEEASSESALDAYHRILTATYGRAGFAPYPKDFYLNVFKSFSPRQQTSLLLAMYQDRPIAGAFWLRDRTNAYYWTGGALREFQRAYPSTLLQTKMIEKAKLAGLRVYDLTGIDWYRFPGISLFKAGFGGQVCRFPAIRGRPFSSRMVGGLLNRLSTRLSTRLGVRFSDP